MDSLTCDVCQKAPALGVASSGLGPISWAYCADCVAKPAEPACMIEATVDGCGGVENIADWVFSFWTYIDGEYVTFRDADALLAARGDA